MRPENVRMQEYLAKHGVKAHAKYMVEGSLRGSWRLYWDTPWSASLAARLNALGFTDCEFEPLGEFSGNGGMFSVFVRGHDELLNPPPIKEGVAI